MPIYPVTYEHDRNAPIEDVEAESPEAAARAYALADDVEGPASEVRAVRVYLDEDRDAHAIEIVAVHPPVPPCKDAGRHVWRDLAVEGSGGGVLVDEGCARCGLARRTDTWARCAADGTAGYLTIAYDRDDARARRLAEDAAEPVGDLEAVRYLRDAGVRVLWTDGTWAQVVDYRGSVWVRLDDITEAAILDLDLAREEDDRRPDGPVRWRAVYAVVLPRRDDDEVPAECLRRARIETTKPSALGRR